ncbi:MAG: hypothetical protein EOO00_10240 [Chitinophagaceae bacterium]|nr:MAG: hypothetical protein EOO00_10240 [Chitinophagaceae bacterium]
MILHISIFMGFGHAGAIMGLMPLFGIRFLTELVQDSSAANMDPVSVVGLLTLIGYLLMITAAVMKPGRRSSLYYTSAVLLSSSIAVVFWFKGEEVIYLPFVVVLPFVSAVLLPLFYPLLKKAWRWALD